MAGSMNSACRNVRSVLTECLMLGAPLPETAAQHLTQCQECLREAAEIEDVVRTLHRGAPGTAGLGDLKAPAVHLPPELGNRVHEAVARASRVRVRRRHRIAVGAAAVLAATATVFVPVLSSQHAMPSSAAVAIAREGRMVPHAWGTEVPVALTGLRPDQTYRLMTADASGRLMPGGSIRVTGNEKVSTRIMTAMPRAAIAAVLVEDWNSHVVAHMSMAPPSPSASA